MHDGSCMPSYIGHEPGHVGDGRGLDLGFGSVAEGVVHLQADVAPLQGLRVKAEACGGIVGRALGIVGKEYGAAACGHHF